MTGIPYSHTSQRRKRSSPQPQTASLLSQLDIFFFCVAILLALFVLPFVVGGRHPAGYAVLSIAGIMACVAWIMRVMRQEQISWTVGPGEFFLALGLIVGSVQLCTLSEDLMRGFSQHLYDILPAYSGGTWSLGLWGTLSVNPSETYVGLSILLAQGVLAIIVYQFARSIQAIERILYIVVAAALILSLHGLIQFVGHIGNNFDIATVSFHREGGIVKSMFRNRNDFAGFLAIAIGPVLWCIFRCKKKVIRGRRTQLSPKRIGSQGKPVNHQINGLQLALGLGILSTICLTVFLSLSRGGSIALVVGSILGCGMLMRTGHVQPKLGFSLLAALSIIVIALQISGMAQVSARAETLFDSQQFEKTFGRQEVWRAACQTISAFPLLGTGIGTHGDISPMTMPSTDLTHFVHAENSYLNLAVETGFIGLGITLIVLFVALAAAATVYCKGSSQEQVIAAAIFTGLVAGMVHAIGHFNWYVPAITTLMVVLGTCGIRIAEKYALWLPSWNIPVPRVLSVVVVGVAMVLLGLLASEHISAALVEPQWDEAVKQSRLLASEQRKVIRSEAALSLEITKSHDSDQAVQQAIEEKLHALVVQRKHVLSGLNKRILLLEDVVAVQPNHANAWAELATARCEHFGLSRQLKGEQVTLVDLRQAALSGGFKSRDTFEAWLSANTGDDLNDLHQAYQAAKRAVVASPFQGEAWCVLANLAFLETFEPQLPQRCLAQALIVRPHSGTVLFEAARQAELDGDVEQAVAYQRECFHISSEHRTMILNLLRTKISAPEAMTMLTPDLAGLRAIDSVWSLQSTAEDMRSVREHRLKEVLAAAEAARTPKEASQRCTLYCEASNLFRTLGEIKQASLAMDAAIKANPSHYGARLTCVDLAILLDDPDTAKQHIDWLLLRRPDASAVKSRLNQLRKLRVRLASEPTQSVSPHNDPHADSGVRQQ